MSNKWQVIMLGVVIVQGAGLGAMEKTPDSPRRNPLGCSAEVRKEAAVAEALKRKNSNELSQEAKAALNRTCWHSGCWGRYEEDDRVQLKNNSMRDTFPYFPGR